MRVDLQTGPDEHPAVGECRTISAGQAMIGRVPVADVRLPVGIEVHRDAGGRAVADERTSSFALCLYALAAGRLARHGAGGAAQRFARRGSSASDALAEGHDRPTGPVARPASLPPVPAPPVPMVTGPNGQARMVAMAK